MIMKNQESTFTLEVQADQTACPLVGSGIRYMDDSKDYSVFGLGLPGFKYH